MVGYATLLAHSDGGAPRSARAESGHDCTSKDGKAANTSFFLKWKFVTSACAPGADVLRATTSRGSQLCYRVASFFLSSSSSQNFHKQCRSSQLTRLARTRPVTKELFKKNIPPPPPSEASVIPRQENCPTKVDGGKKSWPSTSVWHQDGCRIRKFRCGASSRLHKTQMEAGKQSRSTCGSRQQQQQTSKRHQMEAAANPLGRLTANVHRRTVPASFLTCNPPVPSPTHHHHHSPITHNMWLAVSGSSGAWRNTGACTMYNKFLLQHRPLQNSSANRTSVRVSSLIHQKMRKLENLFNVYLSLAIPEQSRGWSFSSVLSCSRSK